MVQGGSPYEAMYDNPVGFADPFGNDPPGGGGSSPLAPGSGPVPSSPGVPLTGSDWNRIIWGSGTQGGSSTDNWESTKRAMSAAERAGLNSAHGRVAGAEQDGLTSAHSAQAETQTWSRGVPSGSAANANSAHTAQTNYAFNQELNGNWKAPTLADVGLSIIDPLWVGTQTIFYTGAGTFAHGGNSVYGAMYAYSPTTNITHINGSPTTATERLLGVVDVGLTLFGGPITRGVVSFGSRLAGPIITRMFGAGVVEVGESVATPVAEQLLFMPESAEVTSGQGAIFAHFTNAEGATGITGIDVLSLSVGEEVEVGEVGFGVGVNNFLSESPGDIFFTDLGVDATPGQLNSIGVFESSGKQDYAILFSERTAAINKIRLMQSRANVFTAPGNTIMKGSFILKRLK